MQRILLIDDDELILMTVRNALEGEGIEVMTTADGPQGIGIFERQKPDLVLLDIGLPSMNGLDVLRKIREIDPTARVIIMSGYASSESIASAMESGAWDFVEKPTPFPVLVRKIRDALATRS
jgi:DNA-binding response OmpR family regulator